MSFDYSAKAYNQYNQLPTEIKMPVLAIMKALKKLFGKGYNKNTDFKSIEVLSLYSYELHNLSYTLSDYKDLLEEIQSVSNEVFKGIRSVKEPLADKYDEGECSYIELEMIIKMQTASVYVNPFSYYAAFNSMKNLHKKYKHKIDNRMAKTIMDELLSNLSQVEELLNQANLTVMELNGKVSDCNRLEQVGIGWYRVLFNKFESEEDRLYWYNRINKYSREVYDEPKLNKLHNTVKNIINI